MSPTKKSLMVLAIVGIVIAASYFTYSTYVSGGFNVEDGAPDPEIVIRLTEISTGETDSITIDPTGPNAATTVTSTLFAVKPTSTYIVEFIINFEVQMPPNLPANTTLLGYATLGGSKTISASEQHIFYNFALGMGAAGGQLQTPETSLMGSQGIAQFTRANNLAFDKVWNHPVGQSIALKGSDLGGSIWNLVCHAQTSYAGTNAFQGTTAVTINMTLGGENLTVTASGITVNVTTP